MSFIPSLKTLSHEAILKHPKLEFLGNELHCRIALDKTLDSEVAIDTLRPLLENPYFKTIKIIGIEKKIGANVEQESEDTIKITLGMRDLYYHTQASKDEIPSNYLTHFKANELKKVAGLISSDASLFHEFYHANNWVDNLNSDELVQTLTLQKDMDNEEERVTILYGENAYLMNLNKPTRIDHKASSFPDWGTLSRDKYTSKLKRDFAFQNYLVNGLHVDTIKMSEKLTNEEIESVLSLINEESINSEYFLEIVLALIKERELNNIDFSDPKWEPLLKACLKCIPTYEQFQKLEQLRADPDELLDHMTAQLLTLKTELKKFSNYNFNKIIKLTSAFGDVDLLLFLQKYAHNFSPSRYFLDMILFLINDRKLNIDFDNPNSAILFNVCTRSVRDIKQFKNFRKVLSKKPLEKLDKTPIIFKNLLYNLDLKSLLFLSQNYSNTELEDILSKLYWDNRRRGNISTSFLDNLLSLIETRNLDIDFSDSKWANLLELCLAIKNNTHQLDRLQMLGAKITMSLVSGEVL